MGNLVCGGIRVGILAALLTASVGCSLASSEPPPPPHILANGVPGAIVTHCISGNYCADGGLDPQAADNPVAALPITLTFEEPISHITAEVAASDRDWEPVELLGADSEGRPSSDEIRITQLPPGEWEALYVSVGMPGDVSVGAAWEFEGH